MLARKKWEDLTIQDDFLFKKVMKNRRICTKMLEKILHIKVGRIAYHEEEKSIDMRFGAKGVRLDVYVQEYVETLFHQNPHGYEVLAFIDCHKITVCVENVENRFQNNLKAFSN